MSQPSPKPNNSQPIHEQVIEDMKRRAESGKASYGTYLQVNNGRDPLLDAYEEAMDMALYLKQAILERSAVNRERILGAIEALEEAEKALEEANDQIIALCSISDVPDSIDTALAAIRAARGSR